MVEEDKFFLRLRRTYLRQFYFVQKIINDMVNVEATAKSEDTAILSIQKTISRSKISILLIVADNSERSKFQSYLATQTDFAVIGSIGDPRTVLEQIQTLIPDVALIDIEMLGINGVKVIKAIAKQFAQTKVIVFGSRDEDEYINPILDAGAKGYLLKITPPEELAYNIRFVHKGYLQFSPGRVVTSDVDKTIIPPNRSSTLSSSEIVLASPSQVQPHDWSSQTKELIDTLPQVWTRGLFYFLAIFATIALPWAMLSKVDETGTARGRLEPSGKTFIIDAPVAGTVAAIKVKAGDVVGAGQNLLELESDLVGEELQQLQTQLLGQQNQLDRLKLLKKQLLLTVDIQEQESQERRLEKQAQVAQARQQLDFYKTSYDSQKSEKLAQVNQAKQDIAYTQTALNSAQKVLAKAQKEIERYRKALKQGIISEVQVVEQENVIAERQQAFDQAQSELQQAQLRLTEQQNSYAQVVRQAESDINKAQLQLQEQDKGDRTLTHTGKLAVLRSIEQLKTTESEIATLSVEIAQSKSQIASAQYELKQRVLKAPVKGTVFDLLIQKTGEVVQPGDAIAEIAPEGSPLVVIAEMATSESGSLATGMPVKLKFDAYPFQDYGVVTGKLTSISPTSKVTETEEGQVVSYDIEIELDRNCIPTANQCIVLRPGNTATAEVIVRQRRVIDFILDPFKKLQKGGLDL